MKVMVFQSDKAAFFSGPSDDAGDDEDDCEGEH